MYEDLVNILGRVAHNYKTGYKYGKVWWWIGEKWYLLCKLLLQISIQILTKLYKDDTCIEVVHLIKWI